MALIKCPECGATVSSAAVACPKCGYPIAGQAGQFAAEPVSAAAPQPTPSSTLLLEVRPSWWQFFWYLLFAWLIIPWLIAWIKRSQTIMRVYHDRVVVERGLFNRCLRELFIRDIRAIDIDQSLRQRLAHIGNLTLSTAATADAVEELKGIPDPQAVRDLIIAQRQGQ